MAEDRANRLNDECNRLNAENNRLSSRTIEIEAERARLRSILHNLAISAQMICNETDASTPMTQMWIDEANKILKEGV